MSVETIPGTRTPLSGFHYVCPCGWTWHARTADAAGDAAAAHQAEHRYALQALVGR